jgi:uroporphyrinogen-III synthase
MSTSGPLAGQTIVVTRPLAQAGPLAEAITFAGGQALLFPLLEILPATDPTELPQAIARLNTYSLAIFISPNAVDFALPAILAAGSWPATLRPAAVGPGTARALAAYGIGNCLLPLERFDSEALLELPELAANQVHDRPIVIFRGDGGRELLADTLRQRGAEVECISCYRRSGPTSDAALLTQAWQTGQLSALTVSSSEALRHLLDLLDAEGRACLQHTPIFVPHARIAENARALGLEKIILTAAANAGIIASLVAYNWPV